MTDFTSDSIQHEDADPSWIKMAYGTEAARYLSERGSAKTQIDQAVIDFYTRLKDIPSAQAVLDNLSPAEAQHLAAMQKHYLSRILSPNLSAETHYQMAIEAGYRHIAVGLPIETLTESMQLYRGMATTVTQDLPNADRYRSIIETRLHYDLLTQIKAYSDARTARLETYARIERLTDINPQDFLPNVLRILKENMPATLAGVAVGSVSRNGYQHIFADGVPWQGMDHPIHASVFQRAWTQEEPLFIDSMHYDQQLPADFREECHDLVFINK